MGGKNGATELPDWGPGVGLIHNPNTAPLSNRGGNWKDWLKC